jgi:hypothetical protein
MPDSTLNRRSVALLQTESNRLSYPQKTAESPIFSPLPHRGNSNHSTGGLASSHRKRRNLTSV